MDLVVSAAQITAALLIAALALEGIIRLVRLALDRWRRP